MSFKLSREAWKTPLTGNVKYVLLALSDYADKRGICYPGIDRIAIKCGLGNRTVIAALNELRDKGYLINRRRFNSSNVYKVILPKDNT